MGAELIQPSCPQGRYLPTTVGVILTSQVRQGGRTFETDSRCDPLAPAVHGGNAEMNHWTRLTRNTDASLRMGGFRRAGVLIGLTCALVLAFSASSAFAGACAGDVGLENCAPLAGNNFEGGDANRDNGLTSAQQPNNIA